jgi:serine/threonine protein kinase
VSQAQQAASAELESLVARVVDEFLERQNRGEDPDPQEFAARHPEAASVLREVLAALRLVGLSAAGATADERPGLSGTLGDFRIIREVGRGGMGVVYEAVQVSLERRVALKVLPFAVTLDGRQLARFKNEAQTAAQLHHSNIVPVYAVGSDRGVHYYAMQFVDGQSLAAVIEDLRRGEGNTAVAEPAQGGTQPTGPFPAPGGAAEPPPATSTTRPLAALSTVEGPHQSQTFFQTVARLGIQAAEALEYAHQMGVVHRDVKPANLMLDALGHLWVTDFGLAQVQRESRLTMTGDLLGTLRYMSPEQALAQKTGVDARSDVYSLGATLYELLTREPVFGGTDRQTLLRQIAFDEPIRPRRLNAWVPAELETVVLKALAKRPEERYASAQDLADDLKRWREDRPILARRPTLWQRLMKWARRHRAVVATALAGLVLAVGVLSVSLVLLVLAYARADEDRRKAEASEVNALDKAAQAREAVDTWFTGVAQEWLDDEPHLEPTQEKFLRKALEAYEVFAQEQGEDPEVRHRAGLANLHLGQVQLKLGQSRQAEKSFRAALALLESVAGGQIPLRWQIDRAASQTELVRALLGQQKLERAEAASRQAVSWFEEVVARSQGAPEARQGLAGTLLYHSTVLGERGQPQKAEKALVQARDQLKWLVRAQPGNPNHQRNLGIALGRLGRFHLARGDQAAPPGAAADAPLTGSPPVPPARVHPVGRPARPDGRAVAGGRCPRAGRGPGRAAGGGLSPGAALPGAAGCGPQQLGCGAAGTGPGRGGGTGTPASPGGLEQAVERLPGQPGVQARAGQDSHRPGPPFGGHGQARGRPEALSPRPARPARVGGPVPR